MGEEHWEIVGKYAFSRWFSDFFRYFSDFFRPFSDFFRHFPAFSDFSAPMMEFSDVVSENAIMGGKTKCT